MERKYDEDEPTKCILLIIPFIFIIIILFSIGYFTRRTYQITFDSNGGSEVASVTVRENDKITRPDDPTRQGYVFEGWYYNDELYDFETRVKQDMVLQARWMQSGGVDITGVTVDPKNLDLLINETVTLKATVLPENARPTELLWTTSNEDVVSVDQYGNVTANSEGTATVTVTTQEGGFSAECVITVMSYYRITLTEIPTETGVFQYRVNITKNGQKFTDFLGVQYNNNRYRFKGDNPTVSAGQVDKAQTTAVITLNDGKEVVADVIYN